MHSRLLLSTVGRFGFYLFSVFVMLFSADELRCLFCFSNCLCCRTIFDYVAGASPLETGRGSGDVSSFCSGGFWGLKYRGLELLFGLTNDLPFPIFLLHNRTSGSQMLFGKWRQRKRPNRVFYHTSQHMKYLLALMNLCGFNPMDIKDLMTASFVEQQIFRERLSTKKTDTSFFNFL